MWRGGGDGRGEVQVPDDVARPDRTDHLAVLGLGAGTAAGSTCAEPRHLEPPRPEQLRRRTDLLINSSFRSIIDGILLLITGLGRRAAALGAVSGSWAAAGPAAGPVGVVVGRLRVAQRVVELLLVQAGCVERVAPAPV